MAPALLALFPEVFRNAHEIEIREHVAEVLAASGWKKPWVAFRLGWDLVRSAVRRRM